MSYTDVYVAPIRKSEKGAYKRIAELSAKVWRDHGALSYVEIEADDVKPGTWTSFPRSVDLKDDEFVVVALITYRSRAHRDEVNAKVMADPRMAGAGQDAMPFDPKRIYWGGFKPFVGSAGTLAGAATHAQPYLFFRGRCEEALDYYKSKLGAEVELLRFKDNPDKPGADKVPPTLDDKVMHACLRINSAEILLSDGMRTGPLDFQCMSVSLSVPEPSEVDRLFNALAEDGCVQMPLAKTFFSPRFGCVADKFGVSWMIGVHPIE